MNVTKPVGPTNNQVTSTNIPGNANSAVQTSNNNPGINSTTTNINPAIAQKLTKGSQIQMPSGPNKQQMKYQITNVDANKNVTLSSVQNPTQPGQVYSSAQMASLINTGNIK
jgi:hypothetical protein